MLRNEAGTRSSGKRRSIVLLLAAASCLVLTGCQALDRGAVKVDQGQLVFAVCSSLTATSIQGATYTESENGAYQDAVWSAEGDHHIVEGSLIEFGVAPSGMTTTLKPDGDFEDKRVVLKIVERDGTSWQLGASWKDVREDQWRDQDGNYRDLPCAED